MKEKAIDRLAEMLTKNKTLKSLVVDLNQHKEDSEDSGEMEAKVYTAFMKNQSLISLTSSRPPNPSDDTDIHNIV
jgi:hypothetical protein